MAKPLNIIVLSFLFVLGLCGNAYAEPVTTTIVTFLTWLGGGSALKGAVIALLTIASTAYSVYQQNQLKKRLGNLDDKFGMGMLVNTRSGQEVVDVVYGEIRKGGNQVYISTDGSNNEYCHIIQTIGEGPIDSVVEVYLDDKLATDPFFNGGYVSTEVKLGTSTQSAVSLLPNDPMRYTAYLHITLKFDQNKFQGIPLITYKVKGKLVYDPRDASQIFGDESTYKWSDNPALIILDLMTNSRYGLGFPAAIIDFDSFIDAANFCDQPYPDEPNFKFTFNGVLNAQDAAGDVINRCMLNMRGYLQYSDGQYKLKYYKYDSPVMHIDANDIVEDSFEFKVPGLPETPNKLKVNFIDPDQKYTISEFPYEDLSAITIDGMEREQEINLIGTTNYDQATRHAVYLLERQRLNKVYTCTIGSKGLALEVGDVIAVTYDLPGWVDDGVNNNSGRLVRITHISYNPDYSVSLTFVEEDSKLYDKVLNINPHTYFSSTFIDPLAPPPSVNNVTFTEEVAYNKNLTYSRLKVSFSKPSYIWWDYAEVYVSFDGVNYKYLTSATQEFYIDPAEGGRKYWLKFYSVSINGVKEDDTTAYVATYTVQGAALAPVWPQGATFDAMVAGDVINFRWTEVTDIDLSGYEIRRGDSWGAGVVVAFIKTTTFMAVGVKKGIHTFWVKAKDTSGNYTSTALSVTCEVFLPANYDTDTYTYLTNAAVDVVISDCDTAWTPVSPITCVAANTNPPPGESGSYVEFTIPDSVGIQYMGYYNLASSVSLTSETHIGLWVWSSIDLTDGQVRLMLDDNYGCPSPIETLNIPAIAANTWTYVNLQMNNPSLCSGIYSVGLKISVDLPAFTFRVDQVWGRDGAHYNTEWIDYGIERVLRVKGQDAQGQLKGYWESPVYDLGLRKKMRFWSDYELIQNGDELRWEGKYGPNDTWEKYDASMTWAAIFAQTSSSLFSMDFYYSDDKVTWYGPVPYFHIYSVELETRYMKYRVSIEDASSTVYLYVQNLALIRAYWQ
jgi:hypothetical protein